MGKQWSPIRSRSASPSPRIPIPTTPSRRLPVVSWEAARMVVFLASTRLSTGAAISTNRDSIHSAKSQFTWQYTMVGRAPFGTGESEGSEETTEIRAPVVPGSLDLRNFDGSPRFVDGKRLFSDGTRYVNPVLNSPVFSNTSYGSSASPTQYTDAVQRAEFFNKAASDWHTRLRPRVGTPRTMVLIRGTYRFALNADGSCCAFVFIDEGTFLRTSLASRRCLDWLRAGSLRRNTTGNAASRTLDRRSRGELRVTPASFPFSRPTFALRVGILTFPRSPSSAFDRTNKVIDSRRLHSVTFPPWRSEPSSCGDRFPAS